MYSVVSKWIDVYIFCQPPFKKNFPVSRIRTLRGHGKADPMIYTSLLPVVMGNITSVDSLSFADGSSGAQATQKQSVTLQGRAGAYDGELKI